MEQPEVTLTFKPQALEYVCNVLAQRPYAEVVQILADIQRQLQARAPQALPNGQDVAVQ